MKNQIDSSFWKTEIKNGWRVHISSFWWYGEWFSRNEGIVGDAQGSRYVDILCLEGSKFTFIVSEK